MQEYICIALCSKLWTLCKARSNFFCILVGDGEGALNVASQDVGDELVIQIQLKDTQRKHKKKRKTVYSKQTKKVKWQDFDDDNLISLGKRAAQNKSGYEFRVQYDFREFFFQ